jgi:site-specific recombinase XerD
VCLEFVPHGQKQKLERPVLTEPTDPQLLVSFQEYLVRQGMSPATVKNYLADLRAFAQWWDARSENGACLLDFSAVDLRGYCTQMSNNGLACSTVNRRLQALRKFGQFAIESRLLANNPAQDVARLCTERRSPPRTLTLDEADALLEAVLAESRSSQAQRDYAIVLILASCGIRLRELVDLQLEDVELGVDEGYLMIGSSAAEGGRVIPFGAATGAALRAYLRVRPNVPGVDYFFLSREGRPISQRSVQRLVARYARAAGLESVSPQTLRATFAHAMLEGTQDLKIVAKLMGHRSTAVTARYFEQDA